MTRNPNAFVVGAPKCGTTALSRYLSQHPNVFFSHPKEPFFFCDDFPKLRERQLLAGLEDYLHLFDEAKSHHSVIAEGSTNYLFSQHAVPKIMRFNANARLIVMLRNPVELIRSLHLQQLFCFNETETDIERAWNLQDERADGRHLPRTCLAPQFLHYRQQGMLGDQVERMLRFAPRDQVLFLVYEEFKCDTKSAYERTLAFLGLESDGRTSFPLIHRSRFSRFPWLHRIALRPPRSVARPMMLLRRRLARNPSGVIKKAKEWLVKSAPPCEPMNRDFNALLYDEFRDDVTKLESLIGRDLSQWRSG